MRWWLRAAVLSLLAGVEGKEREPGAGGEREPAVGGERLRCWRNRCGVPGTRVAAGTAHVLPPAGRGPRAGDSGRSRPAGGAQPSRSVPAGSGQSPARAVVGRVGQSTVLGCDLLDAHEARPPLYVIEWVRFGFVLPIFIKFGLYSPRVDPEYIGESRWAVILRDPWAGSGVLCPLSPCLGPSRGLLLSAHINHAPGAVGRCWALPTLLDSRRGHGGVGDVLTARVPSLCSSARDGRSGRQKGHGYPAWGAMQPPAHREGSPRGWSSWRISRHCGQSQQHPLGTGDLVVVLPAAGAGDTGMPRARGCGYPGAATPAPQPVRVA